jgi:hypothetical protein
MTESEAYDWGQEPEADERPGSILEGTLGRLRRWATEPVPTWKARIICGLSALGTAVGVGGWFVAVRNTPMNPLVKLLVGTALGALGAILFIGSFVAITERLATDPQESEGGEA